VEVPLDGSILRADNDWLHDESGGEKDINDWKNSLKDTSQVALKGRIPPSKIKVHWVSGNKVLPLLKLCTPVVSEMDDVNYVEAYLDARKNNISPEVIWASIKELKEETYWMDDEWEFLDEAEKTMSPEEMLSDYETENVIEEITNGMSESIDASVRDLVVYIDTDEEGFDEQATDAKERLEYYRQDFLNWRVKLFRR
jgi:hypothetical protein